MNMNNETRGAPLISVIVPVYRTERLFGKCLESLSRQDHNSFEIILVDDGSPDGCPQMCDDFASYHPNVTVIHRKNQGLVSARRSGVCAARGTYVTFVDSDDTISPGHISEAAAFLADGKPDVLAFGYTECSSSGSRKILPHPMPGTYCGENLKELLGSAMSVAPFFNFGISPSVWSKCFRRELAAEQLRSVPDELTMGEDAALTYPCLLKSNCVRIAPIHGYLYASDNGGSMTNAFDPAMPARVLKLTEYLVKSCQNMPGINEYFAFLALLVCKNQLCRGNMPAAAACSELRGFFNAPPIASALKTASLPLAERLLFSSVRRGSAVLPALAGAYWRLRENR